MVDIQNKELFGKVIADALAAIEIVKLPTHQVIRWGNAIGKAAAEIEENYAFLEWNPVTKTLLILSNKSNEIYEANGVCQCKAFQLGFPCWHKAAKKLIQNYLAELEKLETAKPFDMNSAPYLKQGTNNKPEKYGNIRI